MSQRSAGVLIPGTASDHSAIGVAVNDLSGRFLLVDRNYCEITGYSQEELTSRTFQSITHPDDLRSNSYLARRMIAGEVNGIVYEKRYLGKDLGAVSVRNSVSMVRDSAGNPMRSVTLTERIDSASPRGKRGSAVRGFRLISKTTNRSAEEEKRRIARDLHDGTGQLLAGLVMVLTRLRSPQIDAADRDTLLEEALDLASECSREVRTLSYLLHPPLLDEFGLTTALETYVEGFCRRTAMEVKLEVSVGFGRIARELETSLFRIVQEGLLNVHRHSGSSMASVVLERQRRHVRLILRDWGRGLTRRWDGVGLSSMRERAQLVGGRFKITSNRDGTTITVILPLSESDD